MIVTTTGTIFEKDNIIMHKTTTATIDAAATAASAQCRPNWLQQFHHRKRKRRDQQVPQDHHHQHHHDGDIVQMHESSQIMPINPRSSNKVSSQQQEQQQVKHQHRNDLNQEVQMSRLLADSIYTNQEKKITTTSINRINSKQNRKEKNSSHLRMSNRSNLEEYVVHPAKPNRTSFYQIERGVILNQQLCLLLMMILVILIQASKTGRTDYALAGESIDLTCQYALKDEPEDVKQVTWSKDGRNFLRWKKSKPGIEVLSYTFRGHIDRNSTINHVIMHNVTIDMHGRYKCSVKTDLGTHAGEQDLIIISSPHCKYNDWRIHSEQPRCRESFRFDCRQMFPRPVPSCGLWDDKLNKFIRSVAIDISEEIPTASASIHSNAISHQQQSSSSSSHSLLPQLNANENNIESFPMTGAGQTLGQQHPTTTITQKPRETYRIRYLEKFTLKFSNGSTNPLLVDLLKYAGHLVFKCDISVPETSWKISISHKMFDYQDGCNQDPLEAIERMRLNFSHYATQRMQLKQNNNNQLDDIEMLTTSLRYEIIPPSYFNSNDDADDVRKNNLVGKSIQTSNPSSGVGGLHSHSHHNSTHGYNYLSHQKQSLNNNNNNNNNNKTTTTPQQKVTTTTATGSFNSIPFDSQTDLNCWQRPRIGSFARLSCDSSNRNRNHIKLIGVNLLECRPNGWFPVKSSINNALGQPSVMRKIQSVERKSSALAAAAANGGKRPTRAERPDGQILVGSSPNPNRIEGAKELDRIDGNNKGKSNDYSGSSSSSSISSRNATNNHDNDDNNNNDEEEEDDNDSDDSAKYDPMVTAAAAKKDIDQMERHSGGRSKSITSDVMESRTIDKRNQFENEVLRSVGPFGSDTQDQTALSQSELALLLPACVLTQPMKSSKKFPTTEASTNKGRLRKANGDQSGYWNWFIFTNSSAGRLQGSPLLLILNVVSATIPLIYMCDRITTYNLQV